MNKTYIIAYRIPMLRWMRVDTVRIDAASPEEAVRLFCLSFPTYRIEHVATLDELQTFPEESE
jgi:hypothetical protein